MNIIMVFVVIWLFLLVILHFLTANFKPHNHTCSEYAIGKFGFLMNVAFFSMMIANALLAKEFWSKQSITSILFLIVAVGYFGLGIWKADLTISTEKETKNGKLHLLAGFITMLFTIVLSFVIASQNKNRFLWIFSFCSLISWLGFIVTMNIKKPIIFGIAQRIYIFIISIWTIYISVIFVWRKNWEVFATS